jgi:hypothetical protein
MTNSIDAIRRKVLALAATAENPGASEQERSTAHALRARLQQRLNQAGAPSGDWTDNAFRLGRLVKKMGKPIAPEKTTTDWEQIARQAGRVLHRTRKRLP